MLNQNYLQTLNLNFIKLSHVTKQSSCFYFFNYLKIQKAFLTHGLYPNEQWDNFDVWVKVHGLLFCVVVPILVVIVNINCPSTMRSTLCKRVYFIFIPLISKFVVTIIPICSRSHSYGKWKNWDTNSVYTGIQTLSLSYIYE